MPKTNKFGIPGVGDWRGTDDPPDPPNMVYLPKRDPSSIPKRGLWKWLRDITNNLRWKVSNIINPWGEDG